jgi:hypothetical protein
LHGARGRRRIVPSKINSAPENCWRTVSAAQLAAAAATCRLPTGARLAVDRAAHPPITITPAEHKPITNTRPSITNTLRATSRDITLTPNPALAPRRRAQPVPARCAPAVSWRARLKTPCNATADLTRMTASARQRPNEEPARVSCRASVR